ncbi:MAG: hypothetical protein AAGA37_19850 [Actinomycetota bacterium]
MTEADYVGRVRLGFLWWDVLSVTERTGPFNESKTALLLGRKGRLRSKIYPGHCADAFGGER